MNHESLSKGARSQRAFQLFLVFEQVFAGTCEQTSLSVFSEDLIQIDGIVTVSESDVSTVDTNARILSLV